MPENIFHQITFWGIIIYMFIIQAPYKFRARKNKISISRESTLHVLLMVVSWIGWQGLPLIYIFTPWLDFADYRLPPALGWLGTFLLGSALVVLTLAHRALGHHYSATLVIHSAQSLVTDGIFGVVRHPIYAGIWLWAIAQPLLLHNWIAGFANFVLFIPMYFFRVTREEKMMLECFGEEYRSYMQKTGRILPLRK